MKEPENNQENIDTIVIKRLKRHKIEIILLWLIISIGIILILTGIGVYYYVGRLTVTQQISKVSAENCIVSEIRMLCDFSKALDIVFSLVGIVSIIFALDRLSVNRSAYRMACFIKRRTTEERINRLDSL